MFFRFKPNTNNTEDDGRHANYRQQANFLLMKEPEEHSCKDNARCEKTCNNTLINMCKVRVFKRKEGDRDQR